MATVASAPAFGNPEAICLTLTKPKFTHVLMASDERTRSRTKARGPTNLEETRDGHVITKGSPLAPRAYHGAHGPRGDSRGAQQGLHAAKEATRNELRLGENGWF